jgi:hypothetical protein
MTEKNWSVDRRTTRAIRARLTLLRHERPVIGRKEVRKATTNDEALLSFARRHELSLDWLIDGDLKGLLRMVRHPNPFLAGS